MIMENTNDMESLTLQSVLEAFNAPLNEEQSWAIAYQCAIQLQKQWEDCPTECFRFNGIHSVDVQKDGTVTIRSNTGSTGKFGFDVEQEGPALGVKTTRVFTSIKKGIVQSRILKLLC